jgi:hypothetical protein
MLFSFKQYLLATVLFWSSFYLTVAQETITLPVEWGDYQKLTFFEKSTIAPTIIGQQLDNGKPIVYWRKQLKSTNFTLNLLQSEFELAPEQDVKYLKEHAFNVYEELNVDLKVTNSGSEKWAVAYVYPYKTINGTIHRLTKLVMQLEPSASPVKPKDFVSNSVLQSGNGQWVKISVTEDGIYKINKSFLASCGISTDNLNPAHINIYGNGDGRLPELNSIPRTDDLAVNAIFIQGESDGSFDDNDYILFYGWAPNWVRTSSSAFDPSKNPYSDKSFYFININSNGTPIRIQNESSLAGIETQTVTSYDYRDDHEVDLVNLVQGGQRWYGELFDIELERTFSFSVPSIVTNDPVLFNTSIATNARSTAGTQQQYSVNGNVLFSSTLPAVSSDYVQSNQSLTWNNPTSAVNFKIKITRSSPSTLVYLDKITLRARRNLTFMSTQFNFRDTRSIGVGEVSKFTINSMPASGFVWDVTDRQNPNRILGSFNGTSYEFSLATDTLREFVASNGSSFYTPSYVGNVSPQNLHGLPQADYLIVTHPSFVGQANRLAQLHVSNGLSVHVVTTDQVFNEYSSGAQDATAFRMFAKQFYDRASNSDDQPKYLLLFGDGTYDPKNRVSNNNNYVLTYQFPNGENHISAMVTDDYYGMLDNVESISGADLLDIAVGRILATDATTARQQVDKIEHYMKNGSNLFANSTSASCATGTTSSTYGDWRMNYVQIADDEEFGYFVVQDTEPQYDYVKANHPEMNCLKLYTDAYTQETTAGGQRYPDVFNEITNQVQRGALVVNYVGHGGEVGLAEERIVTIPQIQDWSNINRMNLFVSATCEFTKYDDPSRVSAGEWVALNPTGGAIALMTTTRSVFFGVNSVTGKEFYENVFSRDLQGNAFSFGEIMRRTKNASGSSDNKRSFTLIGDPALQIALPRYKVVTDSVNGLNPSLILDTISALSKTTIKGHIEDWNGNKLTNYKGILTPSIFDKSKTQFTLGQDPESPVIPFEVQRNVVYKGQATISNGEFQFSFIVPKDINYSFGAGKISYYGSSSASDAGGSDDRLIIGGIDTAGLNDKSGPQIQLYMNDEAFVSGGITNETPTIFAKLFDESGINTVGNGIGHDLVAVIDDNTAEPIVLNEYYTADLDSYQSGIVRYTLPPLEKGSHSLKLKVWDVNNNSSETSIDFVVQEKEVLELKHVLNYPNPFTTRTSFFYEHNQICTNLETQIQVFTVSGRLVKTINENVQTEGFRTPNGIEWDGRDDFGDQLAKGVYIYTLSVKSPDGSTAEKTEKLVLLK